MYPVAAVPKTPARTPAVFDSPNNTPCSEKPFQKPFLNGTSIQNQKSNRLYKIETFPKATRKLKNYILTYLSKVIS